MVRIEIGDYLATDSRVCGGRLIFKGTRILVADVLALVALGQSPDQVSAEYRGLVPPAAVREAVALKKKGIVREVIPPAKAAA